MVGWLVTLIVVALIWNLGAEIIEIGLLILTMLLMLLLLLGPSQER